MMRIIGLLAAVLLVGCASTGSTVEESSDWPNDPERPWETLSTPEVAVDGWDQSGAPVERTGGDSSLFEFGFWFYARGLTQIDGTRCEHRPTCSVYAYRAVRKHGPVIGTMLAVDRLFRADRSSVHRRLPAHDFQDGQFFFSDPVEENDFFL